MSKKTNITKCSGYKCSNGKIFKDKVTANFYEKKLKFKYKITSVLQINISTIKEQLKTIAKEFYESEGYNLDTSPWLVSLDALSREFFHNEKGVSEEFNKMDTSKPTICGLLHALDKINSKLLIYCNSELKKKFE